MTDKEVEEFKRLGGVVEEVATGKTGVKSTKPFSWKGQNGDWLRDEEPRGTRYYRGGVRRDGR